MSIKKIALAVVIAGFMLGMVFAILQPKGNREAGSASSPPSSGTETPGDARDNILQTTTAIEPSSIKVVARDVDIPKNFHQLDKAVITITYLNATALNLTDVQLSLTTSPNSNLGITGVENAELNKNATESQKRQVFDIPDVAANGSKTVVLSVYGLAAGNHTIYGNITSKQNVTTTIAPLEITVK